MTRRRTGFTREGFTLTEVLVTLAILAFGVLAILTLFPLAASQMAIAVREDRSAQSAAAADGLIRALWKTEIVEKRVPNEPFFLALDDPNNSVPSQFQHNLPQFPQVQPNEASYPVVVDPMGFVARSGRAEQYWIGDGGNTNVPRRTLNLFGGNAQYAFRRCSLMDGFGYDEDGHPVDPNTSVSDRELRYNWLWVVQRQQNGNRYAANLTVVVFDNRPHLFAPTGAEATFPNTTFNPGQTSIVVTGSPDLKGGGWVMDASVVPPYIRNTNFYQVVSVTENTPLAGQTTIELQNPIKNPTDNNTAAYTGTLVVLRGVSGVYPRAPLTPE